jgi:5'-3' exonuclease
MPVHSPLNGAAGADKARVYLVDASIYVFRSWFTYPDDLTDRDGRLANAVFGYADFLTRLLGEVRPQHIACAFDESLAHSFRNEIYPPYKANREPAPDELKHQFDWCRRLTDSLGVAQFASHSYEADDIIGTLAARMRRQGHPVTVVSSDKDLTQLLDHPRDRWWDYARNIRLDHDGVRQRYGVLPHQIADLLALAGDSVDNIPGIPGIGHKTAARLLQVFDSVDGIYARLEDVGQCGLRGAARIQRLLEEFEQHARTALRLTRVHRAVPLQGDLTLRWRGATTHAVGELAEQFGFSDFRQRRWLSLQAV